MLPLVHWSQRDTISRVDLSPYPTLQRIYRQSLKHPAFRNSLPEKQVSWKD